MPSKPRVRRRYLFVVTFMVVVFSGLYTGYWHYISNQLKIGVADWIEDQRAQGIEASYETLKISGFPYRFHMDVTQPRLASAEGWVWSGDKLMLVAQSYNLRHVIAFAPEQQTLAAPDGETYAIAVAAGEGSFRWNSKSMQQISLVAQTLSITDRAGEAYVFTGPNFHMSPMPGVEADLRIKTGFDKLDLPAPPRDAEWLGEEVGPLSAPIAITQGMTLMATNGNVRDMVHAMKVRLVSPLTQLNWGPLNLKLRTEGLGVDAANRPVGAIEVRLEDVDALKAAMADAGQLDSQTGAVLDLVKNMTGDTAYLPLTLKDGKVKYLFQELGEVSPVF